MTSGEYPPEAVGPVSGTTPPARLPHIGAKVIEPDGTEGVVAHYQYYDRAQEWFPVRFIERGAVKTRRRRLGKGTVPGRGYVKLAKTPPVTALHTARKPVPEPDTGAVAEHAAAS